MVIKSTKELEEFLKKQREEAAERDAKRKAAELNLEYLDVSTMPVQIKALEMIPESKARKARVSPLYLKGKQLAIGALDPKNPKTESLIKDLHQKGIELKVYIVSERSLNYAWSFYKFVAPEAKEIVGRIEIERQKLEELEEKIDTLEEFKAYLREFKSLHPSEILEVILAGGLANRASDLHFEPGREKCGLRVRIDGILYDLFELDVPAYKSLLSRIKLLSGLKLNIRNRAQDGRFSVKVFKKEIEIRTSTIPSEYGETIVLRLLDPELISLELEQLGLRADDLAVIEAQLKKPNGMILNTGPTGSGKTTTLYAFLKKVYRPEIKIITIEDPIEYHLKGIEQTQVNPEAGYDFKTGLRSILRQDPDVILVGEIRDLETARIAMHAALTGHLVFSTLHTNRAAGAIPRLISLGVEPAIISPALNIIIAQRLVRRLCPYCKKATEINKSTKKQIDEFIKNLPPRVDKSKIENYQIYKPVGCNKCQNLGYHGRIGIFEIFQLTSEVRKAIHQGISALDLLELAKDQQMVTVQQDGIIKALSGITSFEEIERVTGSLPFKLKYEYEP